MAMNGRSDGVDLVRLTGSGKKKGIRGNNNTRRDLIKPRVEQLTCRHTVSINARIAFFENVFLETRLRTLGQYHFFINASNSANSAAQ